MHFRHKVQRFKMLNFVSIALREIATCRNRSGIQLSSLWRMATADGSHFKAFEANMSPRYPDSDSLYLISHGNRISTARLPLALEFFPCLPVMDRRLAAFHTK